MRPQELRVMNVLGVFCGETQQQMQLQGGLGSAQGAPTASVTATVLVPSPKWVLPGAGSISKPSFKSSLDLFPYLPGEGGARAEEGSWVGLSQAEGRGEHHALQNYHHPHFICTPSQGHGIQ